MIPSIERKLARTRACGCGELSAAFDPSACVCEAEREIFEHFIHLFIYSYIHLCLIEVIKFVVKILRLFCYLLLFGFTGR